MRLPSFISLLVLGLSLTARAAHASPVFPPVVRDFLHLGCTPQCILCHGTNEGGLTNINPFGDVMLANGVLQKNEQSVRDALALLEQGKVGMNSYPPGTVDTDGDGIDDITEIKNGDLPAVAGPDGKGLVCADVRYGCGARVAPAEPPGFAGVGAGLFFLLGLGVRVVRRRTR